MMSGWGPGVLLWEIALAALLLVTGCSSDQESSDSEWPMFGGGPERVGVGVGPGPETGEEKWRFQMEGQVGSSVAVAGGTVYVGSHDNHLYAIDADTGQEQWRFRTEGAVNSSPAIHGGIIYIGT